jgi:hypothetical protein
LVEDAAKIAPVRRVYADTAYDNNLAYEYCQQERIEPVIKPRLNAVGGRGGPRGRVVDEFLEDPSGWGKRNGYGQRWQVESVFPWGKRRFGEGVSARSMPMIRKEVILKATLLNLLISFTNQN